MRFRTPDWYRRSALAGGVALVVAGLLGTAMAVPSQAAVAQTSDYVALGDSSAAGPNIPNQIDTTCGRSDHNWPHFLAADLGLALTDVTCSGAKTDDFTAAQFAGVPPQFDALRPDTKLVTVAIGANDIGGGYAFSACPGVPDVATCKRNLQPYVGSYEAQISALAPKFATALQAIRQRSPQATIVVTGYLTYWRPGGCYPADVFTAPVADYLQSVFDTLMSMLASQAANAGATYVDIRTPSATHGLCEPAGQRWLEGRDAVDAYPYHPNSTGMQHAAEIIAGAVHLS